MVYHKHRCNYCYFCYFRFVLSDKFRIFTSCMRYQKRFKNMKYILKTGLNR